MAEKSKPKPRPRPNLSRGELWHAEYGTDKEPRPVVVLIVTAKEFLNIPTAPVLIVPVVDKQIGLNSRVPLRGAGIGIDEPCYAACELLRSIDHSRLTNATTMGQVSDDTMEAVETIIIRLIGLRPLPRPNALRGWGAGGRGL